MVEHRADEPVVAGAVHEMLVHDGALEEAEARCQLLHAACDVDLLFFVGIARRAPLAGQHEPAHHRSTGRGAAHHRACLVARLNGLQCAGAHQQAGQARLVSARKPEATELLQRLRHRGAVDISGPDFHHLGPGAQALQVAHHFLRFFV